TCALPISLPLRLLREESDSCTAFGARRNLRLSLKNVNPKVLIDVVVLNTRELARDLFGSALNVRSDAFQVFSAVLIVILSHFQLLPNPTLKNEHAFFVLEQNRNRVDPILFDVQNKETRLPI